MCLHVNNLPDDCLLPIFDRVPLSDLFQLDDICPRWTILLPSAFARRRTLVLIRGVIPLDEMRGFRIPFNNTFDVSFDRGQPYFGLPMMEQKASLTLPFSMPDTSLGGSTEADLTQLVPLRHTDITPQLVTHLSILLPNVDTLVVINAECHENELYSLIGLLRSPSWSLHTLKLWLRMRHDDLSFTGRVDHFPLRTLLRSINQQSSLLQLTLDIDDKVIKQSITFPIECYSFISQLSLVNICLGKYEHENGIWDIVHRFDHTELSQIGLGNKSSVPLDDALKLKAEFTTKVGQLYGQCRFETVDQLSQFCRLFSSLSTLRMDWSPHTTFTQLVTNLTSLTQLTHLELKFNVSRHTQHLFALVDDGAAEEEEEDDDDDAEKEEEDAQTISLPQVKILQMNIKNGSHRMFESLSPQIFPSVRVIIMKSSRCGPCKRAEPKQDDWQVQCQRLWIRSLKNKFSNSSLQIYAKVYGDLGWFNTGQADRLYNVAKDDLIA